MEENWIFVEMGRRKSRKIVKDLALLLFVLT